MKLYGLIKMYYCDEGESFDADKSTLELYQSSEERDTRLSYLNRRRTRDYFERWLIDHYDPIDVVVGTAHVGNFQITLPKRNKPKGDEPEQLKKIRFENALLAMATVPDCEVIGPGGVKYKQ